MHIVLYHHAVIPPPKYGGTERVLYWLAKALVKKGHRVSLIAQEGSAIPPKYGVEVIPIARNESRWQDLVPNAADIIHLQSTPGKVPKKPFLVTIHGNGQPGEQFHPNTVFLSRKHAEIHNSTHFVYNGIDPDDYQCKPKRGDALVFLAKASWKVKNLKGAIRIARESRQRLEIMGSRDWPFQLHRIRPTIRGIHYRGMCGDDEKRAVLSEAKALLFPVRWNEPFGLAPIEALASGCPVFGTPYGSLPELITPEIGFLSADSREHVRALLNRQFSPETCRKTVLDRFTHHHMATKYLEYYEQILNDGSLSCLNGQEPRTLGDSGELLPWIN
ncbi:MAG TPA: glycosyltransferase [Bdellovibrionota bacterium]|nr:glycosyltransferase [Bdellovibrionota bacterium]